MRTVLCIIGTRPEAIKMAPLAVELDRRSIPYLIVSTGQHRQMVTQTLSVFGLKPDIDLDVMSKNQSPTTVASRIFDRLQPVVAKHNPEWIVVQGDTTSVMAAAIVGAYAKVNVAHLEAGLRTGNKKHPFPEEINRLLVANAADLHLAPTPQAKANLLAESVPAERAFVVGNTVIDALLWARSLVAEHPENDHLQALDSTKKLVLVTAHRRESFGPPIEGVMGALGQLAQERNDIQIIYPVHPNPAVHQPAHRILGDIDNVHLVEPLGYLDLVATLDRSYIVVTDSGGLQEEAPALGRPVLVLRETTERPEAVRAGVARIIGTDQERIHKEVSTLLDDANIYASMARGSSPYGDGMGSSRAVKALLGEPFKEFACEY